VLYDAGVLKNKKFTCYPGFENEIKDADFLTDPVVAAGNVITSRGAGTAVPFALKLAETLAGSAKALEVKNSLMWPY